MRHNFSHRLHRRKKGDTSQLAAQLAPLEEQPGRASENPGETGQALSRLSTNQEVGAIVVDTETHRLSNDIMEGHYGKSFLGMEPVVIVILGFMLAFIAFIAWQISLMPVE
jgi:hypothetical protein